MRSTFRLCVCLLLAISVLPLKAQTFSPRVSFFHTYLNVEGMALRDFNGDGSVDVAFAFFNEVDVFLNDGRGGYGTVVRTVVQLPTAIASIGGMVVGDFNGDGKLDLLVSYFGSVGASYPALFLAGKGDGTFVAGASQPITSLPTSSTVGNPPAVVADFNHDGNLDVVSVSATTPAPVVFNGDGKGNFTAASALTPPSINNYAYTALSGYAIGDVNGDSYPDIVELFASSDTTKFSGFVVYPGLPNGSFGTPVTTPVAAPAGYLNGMADFDGDGKQDLLISATNTVAIARGRGDGTFNNDAALRQNVRDPIYLPTDTSALAYASIADTNKDGAPDLVFWLSHQAVAVMLNDGKGNFSQSWSSFAANTVGNSTFIGVADMDGDGLPDLATLDYGTIINQSLSSGLTVFYSKVPASSVTTTVVTVPSSQVAVGKSLTASAMVSGSSTIPTGNVLLSDAVLGTALDLQPLSNGTATFTLASPASGSHTLVANYLGDTANAASVSAGTGFTVTSKFTPSITVTAPSSSVVTGTTVNFQVTVASTQGLPTGTVTLMDGSTSLGSQTLAGGATVFTTSSLPVGTHSIKAMYGGDAAFNSVSSAVYVLTVTPKNSATVALTSTAQQVLVGSPLGLTVVVAGTSGSPTGSVTLMEGTTSLGQQSLVNGSANFSLTSLPVGSHSLTATYSGDLSFNAAVSSVLPAQIADVTVSLATPSQTLASGSASFAVTLASQGSFTGSVALTCSGLPSNYSFGSASASLANNTVIIPVLVSGTKSSMALPGSLRSTGLVLASLALFACMPLRRRVPRGLLAAFVLTVTLSGCTNKSAATSGDASVPQTINFTITATATLNGATTMHSVPATLVVP